MPGGLVTRIKYKIVWHIKIITTDIIFTVSAFDTMNIAGRIVLVNIKNRSYLFRIPDRGPPENGFASEKNIPVYKINTTCKNKTSELNAILINKDPYEHAKDRKSVV